MQQNYLPLRKTWFLVLSLIACQTMFAQTDQERAKIRDSYQQKLQKKGLGSDYFKKEFENQQRETSRINERVENYLRQHPERKRSYIKDGRLHYIQDIRPDGTPIIITTKDKKTGEALKSTALYPGGSLGSSITGQNMVVGVWDIGPILASHELFQGRAIQKDTTSGDGSHMDHVTGDLIGGDIASKPEARGIAYSATAWCFNATIDKPGYSKFGSDGYLVSNHSYGRDNKDSSVDPIWSFGAYDQEARSIDSILVARPNYLQIWAAGNEQDNNANFSRKRGYDVMTGASTTKNTLQVGALNTDNTMSDFSNWGPTDDGRIKPDICAPGTEMISAGPAANNNYVTGQGTSYAAPSLSGLALLLQQFYKSLNPDYLDAAGLRGVLLHTATDLGQPGPDYKFGWGIANGEFAGRTIKTANKDFTLFNSESKIAKISSNPTVGSAVTYVVQAKGNGPLSVSISWTDNPGTEQTAADGIDPTTPRLVYNFDLKVTAPAPITIYYPWSGPGMANRTENSTRTGTNNVDNFERVDIDNPIAGGIYTITITKATGSPDAARDYTLIATGLLNTVTLPLHLINFSGGEQTGGNLLQWLTAEESGGSYFELEVSNNGTTFTKLTTVNSRGGSNNSYSYTDASTYSSKVYYRLKTIDSDGKISYSTIVTISKGNSLQAITLFPSPANDVLNIQSNSSYLKTKGALYDAYGRLLQSVVITNIVQQLNIQSLPAGVYTIKFQNGKTLQFVKN